MFSSQIKMVSMIFFIMLLMKESEHSCSATNLRSVVGVLGDVESYSGFLRVEPDLEKDSQLFFWFVPKKDNPASGNI